MRSRKIITIIMVLTLALVIVGCGNGKEGSSTETTQDGSNDSKNENTVDYDVDTLLNLAESQTNSIKAVVKEYKVNFSDSGIERKDRKKEVGSLGFSKDELDVSEGEGWKGREIMTYKKFTPDDSGFTYWIKYNLSLIPSDRGPDKNGKTDIITMSGRNEISFIMPDNIEFSVTDAPFLKELLLSQLGDFFSTDSFDNKAKECITKFKDTKNTSVGTITVGSYELRLAVGDSGYGTLDEGEMRMTIYIKPKFKNIEFNYE